MKLEIKYGNDAPSVYEVSSIDEAIRTYWNNVPEKAYKNYGTVRADSGATLTTFYNPYEGVMIHSAQADALASIQEDYGIPYSIFRAMCEQWLADNP